MASAITSWTEVNFSCSICRDVFSSPVSTPCGHNFCRTCITKYWDEQVKYKCPVCNKLFDTRPDLQVNTLLSEMAVKSCLECFMSFCQTHLEPHQRVTVLKKHRLVCVCQFCTEGDHRSHPVVPLKEEYEVKMAQLGKIEAEVQQMIQERLNNIQEIKDKIKCSKADADREIADGVRVITALMRCIEKCQDDLNQMVKERLKSTEKQAEDLIKELEQEIEDLTNRSSEVKQLSQTKDHLHFLQAFRSLKNPPPTRDWTTLHDTELKIVQQYEVDVTLDSDAAQPRLILSEDGRQVHDGCVERKLLDNPKRFTKQLCVLTRQSFSSGRFYFEVQVKDKTGWGLGVARESINRNSFIIVTPETGYWTVYYEEDGLLFSDDPDVRLPLSAELQKVGVFVDYDEGLVSFYDVEARVHIYSATGCTFSEPLYPILCPSLYDYKGNNSAPLIISPVNQTD
uniref:E3 ubiquitin-protein ligase TRIM39-like n=1 Tax=Gadus morhua TaxID=8049 RepID=A0A8C4ZKX6_GADMO